MDFGNRLYNIRTSVGMTREELAKMLGNSSKTVAAYENGQNTPNYDMFIKICNIFKRDANYFMQDTLDCTKPQLNPEDKDLIDKYRALSTHDKEIVNYIMDMEAEEPTTIYRFPVFQQEAAAGVGRLDVTDGYSMEEFIVDNIPDSAVFVIEIAGESMCSEQTDYLIHTGSKVLIDPKASKYNLDGMVVIANFKGETICKRYIEKDTYILFQSDNGAFEKENRKSSDDPDCKIIGIVLGVIENEKFVKI